MKEARCVAIKAAIDSASDYTTCLHQVKSLILSILAHKQEHMEVQEALAIGFCIAFKLSMVKSQLAIIFSQRVQFA